MCKLHEGNGIEYGEFDKRKAIQKNNTLNSSKQEKHNNKMTRP